MSTNQYQFEMFQLRKDVLATVAEHARNDELWKAKIEAKRMIRRRADSGNPTKVAKAFATSFKKARAFIEKGGNTELNIKGARNRILTDHDSGIDPSTDIEGDVVELIESVDDSGWGEPDVSEYPVVAHPSGYRVCTCPSQQYHIVCKHTLARVIERNWPNAPLPKQ